MSPDDQLKTLMDGLRGTLIERATIRNRAELSSSPETVAGRRDLLDRWLNGHQNLSFDPDLSDEAFWEKAFSKPFYIRHVAAVVEDKERTMRDYLGNRKALCSADWNVGGSMYGAFMTDKNCYRNDEQLQLVIGAARNIEKAITAKAAPEFAQTEFPTFMRRMIHGLPDWTSISSLKKIHGRLRSSLGYPFVTTFHLMTDLGFPVVKPDTVLSQVAVRLGLITGYSTRRGEFKQLDTSITTSKASAEGQNPDFVWELQAAMQRLAGLTGYSVRHIDAILVKLGQEPDQKKGIVRTICAPKAPNCGICVPARLCAYGGLH